MNIEIYETIRTRIILLEYEPGRILNEKELASEFNVSRTPLREVLSRLEWEKLVRVIPRTGTMVTEIDVRRISQVFQVRMDIEGLVGRLAYTGINDSHFKRIDDLYNHCRSLKNEYDPKSLVEVDFRLRDILLEAADNQVLIETSTILYNQTVRMWSMIVNRASYNDEIERRLNEIEITRKVLKTGDAELVGQTKQKLLEAFIQRVKDKF